MSKIRGETLVRQVLNGGAVVGPYSFSPFSDNRVRVEEGMLALGEKTKGPLDIPLGRLHSTLWRANKGHSLVELGQKKGPLHVVEDGVILDFALTDEATLVSENTGLSLYRYVHGITPFVAAGLPSKNAAQFEKDVKHPGANDPVYRRQRDAIASLAEDFARARTDFRLGRRSDYPEIPTVDYTPEQHAVWKGIWGHLDPLLKKHGVSRYLKGLDELFAAEGGRIFSRDKIPQLKDVSDYISRKTGFRMEPVTDLVESTDFLSYLADEIFLSTQYIRHHSRPLYTPEPDIVHELVGHAVMFLDPQFARANRLFGEAAKRLRSLRESGWMSQEEYEHEGNRLGALYWWTIEFCAVREDGEVKAVGAGLFSAFGEMRNLGWNANPQAMEGERPEDFSPVEFLPFDIQTMMNDTDYDVTQYQKRLYVPDSFEEWYDELTTFLPTLYATPLDVARMGGASEIQLHPQFIEQEDVLDEPADTIKPNFALSDAFRMTLVTLRDMFQSVDETGRCVGWINELLQNPTLEAVTPLIEDRTELDIPSLVRTIGRINGMPDELVERVLGTHPSISQGRTTFTPSGAMPLLEGALKIVK